MSGLALSVVRTLAIDPAGHPRQQAWLSAASGLVRVGHRWYVVADDEHHLGVFEADSSAPGRLLRLLPGDLPHDAADRKARKPDLETLLWVPADRANHLKAPSGALLALGSGSKPQRQRGWLWPLDGSSARSFDLAPWYAALHVRFGQVNIEGAFIDRERLCLLQRGHRGDAVSACIHYSWAAVHAWCRGDGPVPTILSIQLMDLGTVDGVPLAFTDGCALPLGGWVFSAVAEDTHDAYLDGRCVAAAVGHVDAGGELRQLTRLDRPWKVEGIAAVPISHGWRLHLVTDADDPATPAHLLTGNWAQAGSTSA